MTQHIRQIDLESLDPRGKAGAHLWNIEGVLGEVLGVESRNGVRFVFWLEREPKEAIRAGCGYGGQERGRPFSPAWTSPAASALIHQQPSPLLGWKDPSQIKIAGKEQPGIVLCKSREIRRVSCGLETASHTAVIHSLMKTLPRLAILRMKSFSASDPEQRVVILGQTLVLEDNEGSLFLKKL